MSWLKTSIVALLGNPVAGSQCVLRISSSFSDHRVLFALASESMISVLDIKWDVKANSTIKMMPAN